MEDFLERPLVFFDIESTGNNVARDRIVEIACKKLLDGFVIDEFQSYINPEKAVDPEALKVHGLTDDFLKNYPTFKEIAPKILLFISGCDLAGHNIMSFDIPILGEEFTRIEYDFPEPGIQFVDTMIIQAKIMPRTLSFCYEYFHGIKPDESLLHGAANDTTLSVALYQKQMEKHSVELGGTRADLHKLATREQVIVDFARRFTVNEKGLLVYAFGKNEGKRITSDLQYAGWMLDKGDFTMDTKRWIQRAIKYHDDYYAILRDLGKIIPA